MAEELQVASVAEERGHVRAMSCPDCGAGYRIECQWAVAGGIDVLEIACEGCGRKDEIRFRVAAGDDA